MIRPQATVRRVGRRPTANPKSEIWVWIHGGGELKLPVSLAPRSVLFRPLWTPLGWIWVASFLRVSAAASDQSLDFATGHDLRTSIRAPLTAAFIQLGITSRFQPTFIGLVLPAHVATISKQTSSSWCPEIKPTFNADTNPSVTTVCAQTRGRELQPHKGTTRPSNSDAAPDAHRPRELRRGLCSLQVRQHDPR